MKYLFQIKKIKLCIKNFKIKALYFKAMRIIIKKKKNTQKNQKLQSSIIDNLILIIFKKNGKQNKMPEMQLETRL